MDMDETSGELVVQEPYVSSHAVQAVKVDGELMLAYRSFGDNKHEYKFYDGFGTFVSAQDTFGFYQDGDHLFNNYSYYAQGTFTYNDRERNETYNYPAETSKNNFEEYNKNDMALFSDSEVKFDHNEINYNVDISRKGIYDLGLYARAYKDIPLPTFRDADIAYQFIVSIDGVETGSFIIKAGDEFTQGSMTVFMDEGYHLVNIVWKVPSWYNQADLAGLLNVEIKDIYVADPQLELYDLDDDLDVDASDLQILASSMTKDAVISQDVSRSIFELDGKYYYYYYDASAGKDTYVIGDGVTEYNVQKDLVGDIWVIINDTLYRIVESDGVVTLYENNEGIVSHADEVIELNGIEYLVSWQDDIMTFEWEGGEFSYDKDVSEIILNNTLYKVLKADNVAKEVDLQEVVMDVYPVFSDAVEVANNIYTYTLMIDDTIRFSDVGGKEVSLQLTEILGGDGKTYRVGEAFLGGIFYSIEADEDNNVKLSQSGTPVKSASATRITLGDIEYMVLDNGDGSYVFGRMEDSVLFTSDLDGSIEIFDGDHTTTFYTYTNPVTSTLALFKNPVMHSTNNGYGGAITIMTAAGEVIYEISTVAGNKYRFTNINDLSEEWTEGDDGAVVINGVTYDITLEGDELILNQKSISASDVGAETVYLTLWEGYSAVDTDIVLDDFNDGVFDGWELVGSSGAWSITGASMELYQSNTDSSAKKAIIADNQMDVPVPGYNMNSSISAKVKAYNKNSYQYATVDLYAAYQDENNYYSARFSSADTVSIYRRHEGVDKFLASVDFRDIFGLHMVPGEWSEVAFGLWGENGEVTAKAFISGTEVLSYLDASADSIGGEELITSRSGIGTPSYNRAYFDNVKTGGLEERSDFYDISTVQTADGERYKFDDDKFMSIISDEDIYGNKILRSRRVIELENVKYMITHDPTTDTYYLEDGVNDPIHAVLGSQVTIGDMIYNVSGLSEDDIMLKAVDASEPVTSDMRVFKIGNNLFSAREETISDTPDESYRLPGDKLVLLPDPFAVIEEDFDSPTDSHWTYSGGIWSVANGHLQQTNDSSSTESRAVYRFADAVGDLIHQTNYTVKAEADPYDSAFDLYTRYRDGNNFYRARFSGLDNTVILYRVHGGQTEILSQVDMEDVYGIDIPRGGVSSFEFSAWSSEFGTDLRVFYNGEEVLSFTDNSDKRISSGYVAVGSPARARTYINDFDVDYIDAEKIIRCDVELVNGKYVLTDEDGTIYIDNDQDMIITVNSQDYICPSAGR